MTFPEIALLEPLSVVLAAAERADLKLADPVLIAGAGPIGIAQLLVAAAAGCSPIVITDLLDQRLEFAKKLCPEVHTYKINTKLGPREAAEEIIDVFTRATGGVGGTGSNNKTMPNKILECTGIESSVTTACYATRPGGLVFIIGVGAEYLKIPFGHCSTNEIDIKFLFRYKVRAISTL